MLLTPSASCKSVSPDQEVSPSLKIELLGPVAETAFPVLKIIPSANGKLRLVSEKYPKLSCPPKNPPLTEKLETLAHGLFMSTFSISYLAVYVSVTVIYCAKELVEKQLKINIM